MSGDAGVTCAAYGCPLLGVYGAGKKWFCFCHFNVDHSRNDAITLVINQNRPIVDQILSLRACGAGWKALTEVVSRLIELTRDVGRQASLDEASDSTHATDYLPYADNEPAFE